MRGNSNKGKAFVLLAGLLLLITLSWCFDVGVRLREFHVWLEGLGYLAPVVFVLAYIVATVLAVPGTALTIVAGIVFGSLWGTLYVSIGATIGAGFAFLIARYLGRGYVEAWFENKPQFQKLDRLTKKYGSLIVAVVRLVPLFPYNITNFAFGLTQVSFWTYIFWSWLCMLPLIVLYIVGADVIGKALMEGVWHTELILVFVVLLVFVFLLAGYLKHYLEEKEGEEKERDEG